MYHNIYYLPSPFEDSWAPKKHPKILQDAPFSMVWFGDFLGISWIATPSENGCHSLTFFRRFSDNFGWHSHIPTFGSFFNCF